MTTNPTPARRYDLDWLRILAFGVLIFYHIGMFYVTWDYHVKSSRASTAIEPLMLIVNPWRLELLFFISGVAIHFMADRTNTFSLAGSRFNRLFWPLLFGMLVIVPPQSFCQIKEKGYTGNFLDFYIKYVTAYHGWCLKGHCLTVPTWNHLWYVAYLLVYSLIFALIWPVLKRLPLMFLTRLPAWLYVAVPFALLWLSRFFLFPIFDDTHALIGDWYVHAESFGLFLLGATVARFDRFFEIARKMRWLSLIIGFAAYSLLMVADWTDVFDPLTKAQWHVVGCTLRESQALFMIMACIGFARRHLSNADGPLRRTLTEAIFPFYIIHQTIIVVAAFYLNKLHWPVAYEACTLIALTVGGCWLTYVIVRRVAILRPLFGLKWQAQTARP